MNYAILSVEINDIDWGQPDHEMNPARGDEPQTVAGLHPELPEQTAEPRQGSVDAADVQPNERFARLVEGAVRPLCFRSHPLGSSSFSLQHSVSLLHVRDLEPPARASQQFRDHAPGRPSQGPARLFSWHEPSTPWRDAAESALR